MLRDFKFPEEECGRRSKKTGVPDYSVAGVKLKTVFQSEKGFLILVKVSILGEFKFGIKKRW